jgi:hypothetical protein
MRTVHLALSLCVCALVPAAAHAEEWYESKTPCPNGARLDSTDNQRICAFEDGTRHGRLLIRRDNGMALVAGRYAKGARTGTWTFYADDGKRFAVAIYKKGKRTSLKVYRAGKRLAARQADEAFDEQRNTYEAAIDPPEQGGAFASLTGTADFSSGLDDRDVYGGLMGNEVGEMQGGWGFGTTGKGDLGRTRGAGRVFLASISAKGWDEQIVSDSVNAVLPALERCDDAARKRNKKLSATLVATLALSDSGAAKTVRVKGKGTRSLRACVGKALSAATFETNAEGTARSIALTFSFGAARAAQTRIGNATATGDLDKNIIRRYIRRKIQRVKRCYESQLLEDPDLAGTVVVQFTIDANGTVVGASAGGLHEKVNTCVAGVIESIQFPKPKGGGVVSVRYPFLFKPVD